MKGNLKSNLVKILSIALAFVLVFPTEIFAMAMKDRKSNTYQASRSIMGLATSANNNLPDKKEKEQKSETLKSEVSIDKTKEFTIEKSANLSKSTGKIDYRILVKTENADLNGKQVANFSINQNTDLVDLKVEKVTAIDDNKESEIKYSKEEPEEKDSTEDLSTFAIASDTKDSVVYYISAQLSDKALADIDKTSPNMSIDFSLNEGASKQYQDRFSLELKKSEENEITIDQDGNIAEELLEEVEDSTHLYKGQYKEEQTGLFNKTPAQIKWSDYINPKDNKEFTYNIKLDDTQDTKDSKIKIDYYQAGKKGYELNKDFSQTVPFAEEINLQIPQGYIARIEFTSKVKANTNPKSFSFNKTVIKNPTYKEEKKTEETNTEEDSDPLPKSKQKEGKDSNHKSNIEEKTIKADPDTNEIVVDHSFIKDDNDSSDDSKNKESNSAIDLNRDSVLNTYKNKENLSPFIELSINNISSLFNSYNNDEISYDEFVEGLKSQTNDLSKEDFIEIASGLIAGLNEDTYKVAKIDETKLAEDVFVKEKNTENTKENKDKEEQANNSYSDKESIDQKTKSDTETKNTDNEILDSNEESYENITPEEKVKEEAVERFDNTLSQVNEEVKKPQEDDRSFVDNLSQGIKGIFGQSNLKKADAELKQALNDSKSLEEIQALLLELGKRYELNSKDEAKLMTDNEDAIKAIIARDADSNFRPNILLAQNEGNISPLADKKFTVRTRFDASTINGPIKSGQYFKINLDDKLMVKDPSSLENITYNGKVIAKPSYDESKKVITYTITNDITENISIPLNVDVDYDTSQIKKGENFTVVNSITGLGVADPKKLPEVKLDENGNPAGTITEIGGDDVVKVIGVDDEFFDVNMDVWGEPVVNGPKIDGFNWTIRVSSDKDLKELGYKLNLTTVEGSGLGEIEDVKVNGKSITLDDQLANQIGIVDSKHHSQDESTQNLVYTLYTPVTNKQESYMIDISAILTNKNNKMGAVRKILPEGYQQDRVERETPTRVSMNNRTTIMGEFTSNETANWTITDAVSTGDNNKGLPLETRSIGDNQTLVKGQQAVYGINTSTGKMEVKQAPKDISKLPEKASDPKEAQQAGNIAVYKLNTDLSDPDKSSDYSISGVTISKYRDLFVDQNWAFPDNYNNIPKQTLTVKDNGNNELGKVEVDESTGKQRTIKIPNVKYWNISDNGKATMIDHKLFQTLPSDTVSVDGKPYKYSEYANYYDLNNRIHYISNSLLEQDNKTPATFTVIKLDSKDTGKRLQGAKYYLLGAGVEIITDSNGEATFTNIKPGTYTLKETKAPDGYKLDQEDKTITISDNGEVSVSGKNAQFSLGSGKTDIVEHSDYPNWMDFMNTQHYGKIDESGNLEFYVYLKPYDQRKGGRTDKDTTFNIALKGVDLSDSNITVYDVDPYDRADIFAAMNDQSVDQKLSQLGKISLGAGNNGGVIEGKADATNPISGEKAYQISFPQGRFGDNWGFLVKVSANIGDKDKATLSYDWLAKNDPANQSKIRQNVSLSKNPEESGHPTITITNEEFKKSDIEIAKFADTFADKKRNRLAGAEFVLKNSNGVVIANKTTNENGDVSFGQHPEGTYYLEEIKAPQGYEKSDVYFVVTVDEKGEVSYKAKFKNSDATPTAGVDYYIERTKGGQSDGSAVVTEVHQKIWIDNNKNDPYQKDNIWDAYRLESLKYHLDAKINNAAPGSRFEIQFDPNLDFTQYFKTFPNIYYNGKMIAKPYFDYKTNLLTYVFNDNSLSNGETSISIDLDGMIPSKFYALHSGRWPITVTVAPNQSEAISNNNSNPTETIVVPTDYNYYDKHTTDGLWPSEAYYFRDVYKKDDGQWYVTAIAYYNPVGNYKSGDANKVWFNWLFTDWQGTSYISWEGKGYEAPYFLEDVKVYKTDFPGITKHTIIDGVNGRYGYSNDNMPLSCGIRPEQDPNKYQLVYHADIDPKNDYSGSQNGISLDYKKDLISNYGALYNKKDPPLTLSMPAIDTKKQEGYVIEQTFKIRDIDEFNTHWRAFYMGNGDKKGARNTALNSAFVTGPNPNYAKADQTGEELPSYYKEVVGIIDRKYTPGSFKLTKLDEADQNKKLSGASFILTDADGNSIIRNSGANGEVNFTNLLPGKYKLKEYRAPEKYEKTKEEWAVTVYNDGHVNVATTTIAGSGKTYNGKDTINIPVTNKPAGDHFRVYKKDGNGKPLEGAKFTITKQGESAPISTVTSNNNGVAEFETKLSAGTYIIEEIEAPEGYKKLDKKWVLVIDENGDKKVYNYVRPADSIEIKSIPAEPGVSWIDVKNRPTNGWDQYDNRRTSWIANSTEAKYLGTRIVAINKIDKYVVQRYVINPESASIGKSTATIHREKPQYSNMDWYKGDEEARIFTLDKPVSGLISDIRLGNYNITDITKDVKKESDNTYSGESQRLKLTLPATDKPIVVDVKVPYKSENGGVGTGMDWISGGQTYWKSDYYERVSDIVVGDPTHAEEGSIKGSYIGKGSLDVTNELKTFGFKIKKVKEGAENQIIPGATFKLTGDKLGKDGIEVTSDAKGIVNFDNLKPGYYTLEESKSAPGYEKTNKKWQVTITKEGKAYIKAEGKEAYTNTTETNNARSRVSAYSADTSSQNLEIGDNLVGSPQRASSGEIYTVLNEKSDVQAKYFKVSTSAEYLGNEEFLVRIDIKGNVNGDFSVSQFDLMFNDEPEFVPNSTITWKASANDKDQVPNNSSRWHSGFSNNSIGLKDGKLNISKGDTASMEFKVKLKNPLSLNRTKDLLKKISIEGTNIAVPQAKRVQANKINYQTKNGTITTKPKDWQQSGQLVTMTATPKPGYHQVGDIIVTNDRTKNKVTLRDNNTVFTMPSDDVTISANFEADTFNIYKGNLTNGSVDNLPSQAKTDEDVTFKVTPQNGYKVDKITVTDKSNNNVDVKLDDNGNGKFKMPASNVKVNATFKKLAYNITKQNPVNGDFTVPTNAEAGSKVSIEITPNDGYQAKSISVRGGQGEIPVSGNAFTMPESDVVVDVTFEKIQPKVFSITVNQAKNGSISVDKTSAKENEEVTFTATPKEGYQLDQLIVNGESVKVIDNKYTFKMPSKNVTVSASFKEKSITPPEGSIPISEAGYQITNKQVGLDLKIFKKDKNGAPLEGAEFTLEKYNNEAYDTVDTSFNKITVKSDEKGNVNLVDSNGKAINLKEGYYRLTETKSPLGYKKAKAPWDIEIYEDGGQLKAKYKSAVHNDYDYIRDKVSYDNESLKTVDNGIKYKSKLTDINTSSKTYVQRVYIDTRNYNGPSDKINIQITPKYKREEKDAPGKPPVILEEGVKTAYRSTYKVAGAPKADQEEAFANDVLKNYDLSKNNVTILNTARWRPFDWGFDEDQLNLEKGVYFIDIEGYFDDNITKTDIGKIDLDIDFYDGERQFQEATGKDANGKIIYADKNGGSYQKGNANIGLGQDTTIVGKYPRWVGKEGGRIFPALDEKDRTRVETSIDISSLYSSNKFTDVPQAGMDIFNEKETYNITFSKHGRDNPRDDIDSESVTNNRLEGAVFRLEKDLGSGTYVPVDDSYVGSAFNGYFGFRNLEPGRYRLLEVKAPKGYKPITGPLLYFTIKTVNANSGDIVDPETGDIINIKDLNVRFESQGTIYKLSKLQMLDSDGNTKDISKVDSKEIDIQNTKIINSETQKEVLLKELIVVGKEKNVDGQKIRHEYPFSQVKIVPNSSGYISLEYDNANGVYQYLPEDKKSAKDGKLVDFVTSATAKNMGKIINEKPEKGKLTINKVDENKRSLTGAKFKLTNIDTGNIIDLEGKDIAEGDTSLTVDEDGKLNFENLEIGNYRLEETKSPDGHINTDQEWNFTIGGQGLDPYDGQIRRKGSDISERVTLESSEMKVLRPEANKADSNEVIKPHQRESLIFNNKFKVDDTKINPGDYFTIKLSDSIDLNGPIEENPPVLDIIESGVGTIAKADYDKDSRTITYTFTDYVNTYPIDELSNKIRAFINADKVKETTDNVSVGIGVGEDNGKYSNIKVQYDLAMDKNNDGNNFLNMTSKIVSYNPETGEFIHYFYINRDKETSQAFNFMYSPYQDIDQLKIERFKLKNNNDNSIKADMPESFGVDESSNNLVDSTTLVSRSSVPARDTVKAGFNDGVTKDDSYIIKVTGKVSGNNKSFYNGYGRLVKPFSNKEDLYVEREDEVYSLADKASAEKELTITAVNPSNRISYKKVDTEGNTLAGATFELKKDDIVEKTITTDDTGLIEFENLTPGEYELHETKAPDGYKLPANPVERFKVDKLGTIYRIESYTDDSSKETTVDVKEPGIIPNIVVNKKEQNISFTKVDADDKKPLAGAEFEVYYKADESGDYNKLDLYQDQSGKKLVLSADQTLPSGYEKVDKFISGTDGKVDFKFYEPGYYALKESKAPKGGYIAPKDYIYEFRLVNGKVQVLENDPSIAKKANGQLGKITSEIVEIDKDNRTFKQRLIISPSGGKIGQFKTEGTYLRIVENGFRIDPRGSVGGKLTAYMKDEESKALKYEPTRESIDGETELRYYLKDLANATGEDLLITSPLVVEYTGKLDSDLQPIDIKAELVVEPVNGNKFVDTVEYDQLNLEKLADNKSVYINKQDKSSIKIENKKTSFPLTGGSGPKLALAIIGTALMLAAIAYYGIKQNDKNRRKADGLGA